MAYDIQTTYNSFGGGISDDTFIGPANSVQDMDSVDVQTNDRFATASVNYKESGEYDKYGGSYTWIKTTPVGSFRGNTTEVLNPSGGLLSGTIGSAIDGMESYGTGVDQVNYFFSRTSGIKKTNYNGSSLTSTITSGYPTGVNSEVTAIGWHQANVLFSKLNKIYYLSTTTDTCFDAITLPPGVVVKLIYAYSIDSIVVIATSDDDTVAYELQFNGNTYSLIAEITEKEYKCLKAVGDKYNVYWISTSGLHQYQGRQFSEGPIKNITLADTAKIGFYKGVLIGDGLNVYSYGNKKPGRSKILTKKVIAYAVEGMDRGDILCTKSTKSILLVNGTKYKRENTITLRPLDGGSYQTPKHDLNYRFGFINPEWNGTPETDKCGIKIEIQTDEMQKDNNSFVTVYEAYEDFLGYVEISPNVITDILTIANRKSEFGYATTRITLYAGDELGITNLYNKTPKLFDFSISCNYVKR